MIGQIRCANCDGDLPDEPIWVADEHENGWPFCSDDCALKFATSWKVQCTGAYDCPVMVHIEGCYASSPPPQPPPSTRSVAKSTGKVAEIEEKRISVLTNAIAYTLETHGHSAPPIITVGDEDVEVYRAAALKALEDLEEFERLQIVNPSDYTSQRTRIGKRKPLPGGDTFQLLSAALDEIYRLRRTLAYTARVVEAQTLDVKALGKGRREVLEELTSQLRMAVYSPTLAFAGTSWSSMERELARVAPDRTYLTVESWRDELAGVTSRETSH